MILVMGLGFVGLSTALGFYEKGHAVVGLDLNQNVVDALNYGNTPYFDETISTSLSGVDYNRIKFVTQLTAEQTKLIEAIFICVGTPSLPDGNVDLSQVSRAFESSIKMLRNNQRATMLILKSTTPPGTMNMLRENMVAKFNAAELRDIIFLSNPEFLREGVALDDFINSDRIIIGTEDGRSVEPAKQLYCDFDVPVNFVSFNTAEFIKYSSNTALAGFISIANELSQIAYAVGDIDTKRAFQLLHEDKRWSGSPGAMSHYLYPGCGFGGYCLPKDVDGMISTALRYKVEPDLLRAVQSVNMKIASHHASIISKQFGRQACIGILGLAFKENTDDVRNAPAAKVIEALLCEGITQIIAHDPVAIDQFKNNYNLPIAFEHNLNNMKSKCDVLVIVTGWSEYKKQFASSIDIPVLDLRMVL